MMRRHVILSLMGLALATPAFAQGKKSGGAPVPAPRDISGTYDALGRNPDGTEYSGTCEIVQTGPSATFEWRIGEGSNSGTAVIEGRVVTVDWGDASPVVYVIMEDGALHGTWSNATALERLTPR